MWDLFPPSVILQRMSGNSTTPNNPTPPGQPPETLVNAIRKLVRPLVKLLLSYQLTYPYLINLLKTVYVEVAETEFPVAGKRPSDSRITLLTGVHRKDVKRLRSEQTDNAPQSRTVSTGAQMIGHWMGDARFCDSEGHPLPLPLAATGEEPSFEELVERVCRKDIRPRVILDEWLRLGVATLDETDKVILDTGAFTPHQGFDEKAFFFGKSLHDHISAGTHNLLNRKPPMMDRTVYYDQLSEASVEELQALAEQLGMQALIAVNQRALALQQRDKASHVTNSTKSHRSYRMNFGIFHYNDLQEDQVKDPDHG